MKISMTLKGLLRVGGFLALICGVTENSYSKEYIVKLRTQKTFTDIQDHVLGQPNILRSPTLSKSIPSLVGVENIGAALTNLQMLIVNSEEVEALRLNPEVEYIEEEFYYPAPIVPLKKGKSTAIEIRLNKEEMIPWGITAVKAKEAWHAAELNQPGEGVRVAVIDTGIDRTHPDLKERFEKGKNFVNNRQPDSIDSEILEDEDIDTFAKPKKKKDDFFDVVGHGTHVAGTIAASANGVGVVGVAPYAKILAARVCGKFGCPNTSIIKGVEWALKEKVDTLNMSLGGPRASKALADALDAAAKAGVIPVAASGNGGVDAVSFPAAYGSTIAVGAIDSTLHKAEFSQWGPELAVVAPGVDVMSSIPMGTGRVSDVTIALSGATENVNSTSFVGGAEVEKPITAQLQYVGLGKASDFEGLDLKGKFALIKRGEIPFAEKAENAVKAKAAGILIFNHLEGLISGAVTQDGSVLSIPIVMIEKAVGEKLLAALEAQAPAVTATIKTLKTNYAGFAGTSMASPHVCGVVALLKAVKKDLTSSEARELLKATATHLGTDQENAENMYGSGLVNAEAAIRKLQEGIF